MALHRYYNDVFCKTARFHLLGHCDEKLLVRIAGHSDFHCARNGNLHSMVQTYEIKLREQCGYI